MSRRAPSWSSPGVARLALAATLLAVVGARLHCLDVPLERDEGEFAYMGQLILAGVPPFEAAYNMKLPGTYYAYAALMGVGGESVAAIRLGLLAANLAAVALVYALGRRLLGEAEAALAATAYALASLEPAVLGLFAHATHFVLVPALGGLLLLLVARDGRRRGVVFAAGLLLGTGFLMKQHGIAFVALGLAYLGWRLAAAGAGGRGVALGSLLFGAAAALPFALLSLYLGWQGVFPTFWHWTFDYARQYVSLIPPRVAARALGAALGPIVHATWPLWLCAAIGGVDLALSSERRPARAFAAGLVLFSILAVIPGFYFRPHYFVLLLPALALLCGAGLVRVARLAAGPLRTPEPVVLLTLVAAILAAGLVRRAPLLFSYPPERVSRAIYDTEFFPEYRRLGDFLREHSDPDDTIAVLGSEPEIYFYAQRRSASGFLYTYPLMEPQPFARTMQRQMAAEIERARPRYLVWMQVGNSWIQRRGSDRFIFQWFERFRRAYRPLALYELRWKGGSRFLPGEDARGRRAPWSLVYERRPDS